MRWPLRIQIALPTIALFMATLATVSVLTAWLASNREKRRIEGELRDVVTTLETTNFPLGDPVLAQVHDLTGVELLVANNAGERLNSSNPSLERPPSNVSVQSIGSISLGTVVFIDDNEYFHTVVALDRRSVGGDESLLHLYYPVSSWKTARFEAALPPLVIGLCAAPIVMALAWWLAWRVTRRLERLSQQTLRVAEGDFKPLTDFRGNDEVRDLGLSFNRMATMLAQFEEEVRRAERLQTLGQLGGGIAHQMRNAATGCRLALDLHRRNCKRTDDENLLVATRQLDLMEEYLSRFLSLGREEEHRPLTVKKLLDDVLPLVNPTAEHVGVRVTTKPISADNNLVGAAKELQQMLVNLLLNAIEASASQQDDDVVPTVVIEIQTTSEQLHLEIRDNGAGPSADIADVFAPLVSEKPEGVGLGLSVARDIARRHNGDIAWQRDNGETCFRVTLPNARINQT